MLDFVVVDIFVQSWSTLTVATSLIIGLIGNTSCCRQMAGGAGGPRHLTHGPTSGSPAGSGHHTAAWERKHRIDQNHRRYIQQRVILWTWVSNIGNNDFGRPGSMLILIGILIGMFTYRFVVTQIEMFGTQSTLSSFKTSQQGQGLPMWMDGRLPKEQVTSRWCKILTVMNHELCHGENTSNFW